jgi:hypothetical protein
MSSDVGGSRHEQARAAALGSTISDPTVIFLHVGKTGGWTLRQVLYRNVGRSSRVMRVKPPRDRPRGFLNVQPLEDFAALSPADRERPRLIVSHMIFGIHESVPRPSTYISMLRHPVPRAISQYRHVVRTPEHRLHERASAGMTIEEYVTSGVALEMDNAQTRAIAGDVETPFGQCDRSMLERAKQHIDRHFSVVGLTERFDETLLLLERAFGWRNLYYVRTNYAPDRQRAMIGESAKRTIAEQNWLDCELYEYVSDRLDTELRSSFPALEEDLRRFRKGNQLYRPWGRLCYRAKQRAVRTFERT